MKKLSGLKTKTAVFLSGNGSNLKNLIKVYEINTNENKKNKKSNEQTEIKERHKKLLTHKDIIKTNIIQKTNKANPDSKN